jgi:two-component system, NtrC family, response regulator GlrR
MRQVFDLIMQAAPSRTTILINGESGTGKELVARSLHQNSTRSDRAFITVNSGNLPPDLLESNLFGHVKGAFTGAVYPKKGLFELADKGTIFFDEIGNIPLETQAKLLRVMQEREFMRLGGMEVIKVDVRIVAATNRDLRAEVNARRFRADLYYRLAVVEVRLPPLRERRDDLALLVARLTEHLPPEVRAELARPDFLADLARHSWPGNVRELRNYLERSAALGPGLARSPTTAPSPAEGPIAIDASRPLRESRDAWGRWCERQYLDDLLRKHGDNLAAAARAAAVDRAHLYRLLWKHCLR